MTDHEFWSIWAINVEQAGAMPASGICHLIDYSNAYGLITLRQEMRLKKQLRLIYPNKLSMFYGFYWTPDAVAPRVSAMKKLAKLTRGKS